MYIALIEVALDIDTDSVMLDAFSLSLLVFMAYYTFVFLLYLKTVI